MPFISYAQNDEDVMLWRAFQHETAGFYVDVGAADPDLDSVTRAFYDRGWHGINIEAVPHMADRIAAARPRDLTLAVAAGNHAGTIRLHVVDETGLSTTLAPLVEHIEGAGFTTTTAEVPLRPLRDILDEHAPGTIHFLKIDVEGAEQAVLEGCDFRRHRPRIVLLEATRPMSTELNHHEWEPILLGAGYRFLWFDGLNRFYAAEECAADLAPHFETPVNVFDDVIRVAAQRVVARHAAIQETRARVADSRAVIADDSARAAYARAFEQARELGGLRSRVQTAEVSAADLATRLSNTEADLHHTHLRLRDAAGQVSAQAARADALDRRRGEAEHLLQATQASTSWRITRPLRRAMAATRLRRLAPDLQITAPNPAPLPPTPILPELPRPEPAAGLAPMPFRPVPPAPLRAVHQFHSGSATGDAVTNSMLLIRAQLRRLGYASEIFVRHLDPALAHELLPLHSLPADSRHVLLVHHSLGFDSFDVIAAHPAPKVLYYHNITPPEFLPVAVRPAAGQGCAQLAAMRPGMIAAVAASDTNALDLRRLGFDPVTTSTLLFDLDALLTRAADRAWRAPGAPYTVLFVGRVIESKAQADLIDAFAAFRTRLGRPARLVIAGRTDSPGDYLQTIARRMHRQELEAELVITGGISDDELHAQYSAADLYVSLSHHEGFGVPLVEAAAYGIPVLAWPAGAIATTLPDGLLPARDPAAVAGAMLAIANDPARRAALVAAQRAGIERFALPLQWPALQAALLRAGAAPPTDPAAAEALRPRLRFAVTGHAQGSYSLAAVNRALAGAIEAARPGHVRLLPVETVPTTDLALLPPEARRLAARPAPPSGPEVTISQHYPIHVPGPTDLAMALVFWEESLLPQATIAVLDEHFAAILAPTRFVADALLNSGLSRPVHVIGSAPGLAAFAALTPRLPRDPAAPFTFLHVSSCFPRKGVDVLLAAYAQAFRATDCVRLVIKSFPNPHNTTAADIASLQAAHPALAPIELIDRDLGEDAMLALYATADTMVLPTRGEGLNLPAAEAMAAGLPLIVTGFGGHMDVIDPMAARLLRYRLRPSQSHLATPHSLWAEPNLDDLVAALREAASGTVHPALSGTPAALGAAAMVRRVEDASLRHLLAPPPTPPRIAWVSSWGVRCGVAEYQRHLIAAMPAGPEHVVLHDERPMLGTTHTATRLAWRLGDPTSVDLFEHAVAAENPDAVVIQHQPGLMPWAGLAAQLGARALAGRTVIVTLHNTRELLDLQPDELAPVLAAIARADRLLVHAIADLDRLQDLGLTANVALLPHGVHVPAAPRASREPGAPPVIGCTGFFLPGKGIPELIEALAILRRTHPGARLRLVNAEYDGILSAQEIARARAAAASSGMAEAIEWHTAFLDDDESLALLSGCDVIVLPTQASKEASSAAVRTALASGVPVLTTPIPIFDDVEGAVVKAAGISPDALAAALATLLSTPGATARARSAAAEWATSRSWPVIARRLGGMVAGLIATRRAR